jgi:hypothetical protein
LDYYYTGDSGWLQVSTFVDFVLFFACGPTFIIMSHHGSCLSLRASFIALMQKTSTIFAYLIDMKNASEDHVRLIFTGLGLLQTLLESTRKEYCASLDIIIERMTLDRPNIVADLDLILIILNASPGHLRLVQHLLSLEISAKYSHSDKTPLHSATSLKCDDIVQLLELLIKQGARLDAKDAGLQTPLHLAAKLGRLWAMGTFVKHDLHAASIKDDEGRTAIDAAREEK